jgi:uncharacterized protein YkwD
LLCSFGLAAGLLLLGVPGSLAGAGVSALPAVAPAAAEEYPSCPDSDLAPAPDPDTMNRVENAIFCALNVERARAGRAPFARAAELDRSSQFQSTDMVDHHFFAHEEKGHPHLVERVVWSGYFDDAEGGYYAENLGAGPLAEATAAGIVTAWYGSADHRTNILDVRLSEIGIGAAIAAPDPAFYAGYASAVYTTDFGSRRRPASAAPDCSSPSSTSPAPGAPAPAPGAPTVVHASPWCLPPALRSATHPRRRPAHKRHRAHKRRHRRRSHRHRTTARHHASSTHPRSFRSIRVR